MRRATLTLAIACFVLSLKPAAAQTSQPQPRFEVIGQFTGVTSSEFDGADLGVGGLVAWRRGGLLDLEAETNVYPANLRAKHGSPYSRGRLEGLIGVTFGPVRGRMRPFGTFRTGFVKFGSAPGPLACPAIFPPILPCSLAKGEAVVTVIVGGGMELLPTPHAVLRFDLGDRLMDYPGPAIDANGQAHNMALYKNEFRFTVGAGVRF